MTTKQLFSNQSLVTFPESWRFEVNAQLSNGETVLSAVEVDLDARLHFVKGLLIVTEQRLLAKAPG